MANPVNFDSIPVIDISNLRSSDRAARQTVADAMGTAARQVGFLYVTGHGLDEALFEAMLAKTKEFFALPIEKKMAVYIGNSTNHRGYVPEGEEGFYQSKPDAKEAYDLSRDLPDDPDYKAGNPLIGPNQWPELPGFREAVDAYYGALFDIGRTLMHGFAMALGEAEDVFDRYLQKPPSQLRLIHYAYNPGVEDRPGIGAHSDYECFTLLRSTLPGLEVQNGAGDWIDAPPLPGAFVVNIGDLLELWTNGAFIATMHRVRKVSDERYSFPLFFNVDYDTEVAPLPQFAKDAPARAPLKAGEHLFAQTAQSFVYLQKRLAAGEIVLPDNALPLASFGKKPTQPQAEQQMAG